jgi:hypothetical protein
MTAYVRVELPSSLCTLAGIGREVTISVHGIATQRTLLDALEADFPVLRGTIRDHVTRRRRPFIRFFAGQQDLSHQPPEQALPKSVVDGTDLFMVVGAIAGG